MSDLGAFLWVYDDPARGLALVRGRNVKEVLELAVVLDQARWSVTGKGYVVPTKAIADVVAMAQYSNVPVRIKQVDDGGT